MENNAEGFNEELHVNGFTKVEKSLTLESLDVISVATSNEAAAEDFGLNSEEPELSVLHNAFKQVYKKRISDLENSSEFDNSSKTKEKLHILMTYLEQLEDQNDVLVSTMMELEKEAQERVVQMERRLKSSAKSTMETVINLNECEQEMRRLVNERAHIESVLDNMEHHISTVKVENNFLRDQNFNLSHDIQALLHIIQHARSTGHWEMDCVTFCELTPEQVFGPVQSMSQMYSAESNDSCSQLPKTQEDDKKHLKLVSNYSRRSSQSSASSPSLVSQPAAAEMHDEVRHLQYLQDDTCRQLLEREKTIVYLESQLSEVKHCLMLKEAECQCHLWEINTLRQQRKCLSFENEELVTHEEDVSDVQHFYNTSLQKTVSMPVLQNLASFQHIRCKVSAAKTYPFYSRKQTEFLPKQEYLEQLRQRILRVRERKERQPCRPVVLKSEYGSCFRRAYSEPHLFMYGDSIYVYRPCEPLQRDSSVALHEDYHNSLLPCQSIDLKLPVKDEKSESLRACEWDFIHNSKDHTVPDNSLPYPRVQISVSSCTTSESEDFQNSCYQTCDIKDTPELCCNKHSSAIGTDYKMQNNWYQHEDELELEENNNMEYPSECNHENYPMIGTCFVQTDDIKSYSIGLQADITDEDTDAVKISSENGFAGLNVDEFNKSLQTLKGNLLKAEDKASAKAILVEQLQSHLVTTVKEVELKDTALENVEKKLDLSRRDCAALKDEIISLNNQIQQLLKDLEDAKMLQDNLTLNVDARKEQIEELNDREKMLQDQKRSLMTQLDAQGDELESTKGELEVAINKLKKFTIQIEQQNQIIKSLQEALVQTKRALDETKPTNHKPLPILNSGISLQSRSAHSSRSSVVDI